MVPLLNYSIGMCIQSQNQKEVDPDIVFRWKRGESENVTTLGFWHGLLCSRMLRRTCRKFTNTETGAWTALHQVSNLTFLSISFWPGWFWHSVVTYVKHWVYSSTVSLHYYCPKTKNKQKNPTQTHLNLQRFSVCSECKNQAVFLRREHSTITCC